MAQQDKRKLRISSKPAPTSVMHAGKYLSGWHPAQVAVMNGHQQQRQARMLPPDTFQGPDTRPGLSAKAYAPDQVILFMEDGKGSGVPVLGRRVPFGCNMVEAPEAAELLNEQPVVGRRSHRLYHNHHHHQQHHHHHHQQQQQAHQQRLMIKSHQHHKSKCAMIMNDDGPALAREQYRPAERSQQALSGLQISHLRKGRLHQSRSSANIHAEAYLDTGGQLNWPPAPVEQPLGRPVGLHASRRQLVPHQSAPGGPAVNLVASSSCSSLCSADECRSCCSPPLDHPQQVPAGACREPCCVPSYAQCRNPCCQPPEPQKARPANLAANKPSRAVRHAMSTTTHLHSPDYLYLACELPGQRQGRSRAAHQGGAAQRASSSYEMCHRRRPEEQQPMRISGRNMLPVKRRVPVFVADDKQVSRTDKHQASVSQIYESLAAELKAKLGDPRLAPILLPPKDYDTLSRRQGKLGDIEQRRSTNPNLVGTTALQQQSAAGPVVANSKHTTTDSDEQGRTPDRSNGQPSNLLAAEPSKECDSARSSGRQSHLDGSLVCRSRSNSSSGLGSISMGAGSRNSSPSSKCSSSDDMHRLSTGGKLAALESARNNNNNNKSYAGASSDGSAHDNCRGRLSHASDSGHTDSETPLRVHGDYQGASLVGGADTPAAKPHHPSTGANTNQHLPTGAAASSKGRCADKGYDGTLRWKGRVEIPLKVNSDKNGNTYLATKQIIY